MHRGQINTKKKKKPIRQVNRNVARDLTQTSTNPGTMIILATSFVLALLVPASVVFLFPPSPLYLLHFPVHGKPVSVVRAAVLQVRAVSQYGRLGTISAAILLGFVVAADREPLALDVSLDPEVGEEDEEQHAVHQDEVDEYGHLVFTVFHEVILRDVDRHHDKLRLWKQKQETNEINAFPICRRSDQNLKRTFNNVPERSYRRGPVLNPTDLREL